MRSRSALPIVAAIAAIALATSAAPWASAAGQRSDSITIAAGAQCHASTCFVVVGFTASQDGTAAVSAGSATRTITVRAGDSRRVLAFAAERLTAPVKVDFAGRSASRTVTKKAFTVNRSGTPCATLDPTSVYLSVGPTNAFDASVSLSSIGTMRAAVLHVDFPGAAGVGDPRVAAADWMERSIRFFQKTSYGRFSVKITAQTAGWVHLPEPAGSYDPMTYEGHRAYIQDAIDAADSQIDFGDVDTVLIIASDAAAKSGSQAFRGLENSLTTEEGPLHSAVTFGSYVTSSDNVVFNHEISHTIGLPDLYHPWGVGDDLYRYTGIWDYMSDAWTTPTDLMAWQRSKLGWLDARQTLCAGQSGTTAAVLEPLGSTGGTKAVFVRTGLYTGVVVENRQRVSNDKGICRTGALVYTVDSRVKTLEGPITVRGGSPTGPGCGLGPRSDATMKVGDTRTVGAVRVTVVGAQGKSLEVLVSR